MHDGQRALPDVALYCTLDTSGERYHIVSGTHGIAPHRLVVPLSDEEETKRLLRSFADDVGNRSALQRFVWEQSIAGYVLAPQTEEVLEQAARWLACGRFRLLREPPPAMPASAPRKDPSDQPAPTTEPPTHSFSLQIVDDATDEPISGIKVTVALPGDRRQEATSDSSGRVDIADLESGHAELTTSILGANLAETLVFARVGALPSAAPAGEHPRSGKPPRFLARLTSHQVRQGETLEGIAQGYGISTNDLAEFNWGTTRREEIRRRLWHDVGCRFTESNGQFSFTGAGVPGIIFAPLPVRLRSLALDRLHVLRVRPAMLHGGFVFSV